MLGGNTCRFGYQSGRAPGIFPVHDPPLPSPSCMGDFHNPDRYVWRPGHWHYLGTDDPDHHQVLGCRPSQESGSSPNSTQAQCCKEIPGTAFLSSYAATTAGWQQPRKEEEKGFSWKEKEEEIWSCPFHFYPLWSSTSCTHCRAHWPTRLSSEARSL
jgi:hypothetical protein